MQCKLLVAWLPVDAADAANAAAPAVLHDPRLVEVLYEGAKDTDMAPLGAAPTLQMPQAPRADPSGQLPLPVESTGV